MPPQIQNMSQLIEMVRTGDTAVTLKAMSALAVPAAIAAWHHFKQVQEPGHLDTLDDECTARLGLTPEERAHVDADVPAADKERIRLFAVDRVYSGIGLRLKWRPGRRAKLDTHAEGDTVVATFTQEIPKR